MKFWAEDRNGEGRELEEVSDWPSLRGELQRWTRLEIERNGTIENCHYRIITLDRPGGRVAAELPGEVDDPYGEWEVFEVVSEQIEAFEGW